MISFARFLWEHDVDPLSVWQPIKTYASTGTGTLSAQTDLQAALNAKAASSHAHAIADTTNLQAALDGKAAAAHNHDAAYEAKNANIQTHIVSAHAPSDAQKNSDITKAEIEAKLTGQITSHTHPGGGGEAFPVGSVFIAVVDTNPATLLGYGVWLPIAAGRVLVGQDILDPDFDTLEETGGAKTVTLTEAQLPSHTHVQTAHGHSVTDPGHTHLTQRYPTATGGSSGFTIDTSMSGTLADNSLPTKSATTGVTVQTAAAVNQATGGGQAHPNLPPYLVVKCWKRTA
jgi:microcystin-dependent protein